MAKTLVTLPTTPSWSSNALGTTPSMSVTALPTTPSWTATALGTTPSFTSVSLPSITWILSGGWKDATTYTWEDETRNWEHMGMLGRDSD